MSDEHDNDQVRAAFDRLRHDAHEVDTMAALRNLEGSGRPRWLGLGVLGAAAAAILIVVGIAVWGGGDGGEDVTAAGDPTAEPDGAGPDVSAETLDGSSWVLTSGTGDEGEIPIVAGWPVTLTFDGENLGGTAACNGYGGGFKLHEGSSIAITELSQTDMACDGGSAGDVMASEALFLRALISVDTLVVDGDRLTLTGPSTELVFTLEAPVPTAELVGQLWLLDTLIQGEAASTVSGDPATLLLREDGTLEGGTGCRTFSGEYVVSGASVLFTSFGMSGDCSAGLQTQDSQVVTVLGDGFTVEIDGTRLTLTSQGNEGLSYRAIDEIPDFEPTPSITLEELRSADWVLLEGLTPDGEVTPPPGFPVTLLFDETTVSGVSSCNGYGATYELDGSALAFGPPEGEQEGCEVEAANTAENRYLSALEQVTSASIAAEPSAPGGRLLILTGPEIDLVFSEDDGSEQVRDEAISVSALLDSPPPIGAAVDVAGFLYFRGGSWILCETLQGEGADPFCAGRWVTLTNYDAVVDPHTDPPTGVSEAAFGLANVNPDFEAGDNTVFSTTVQTVTLAMVDANRAAVPEFPSEADPTDEELVLIDAFLSLNADGPVDTDALELADAVSIGLSDQLTVTRTAGELADPANWELDLEAFRGRVGPFSALDLLGSGVSTESLVGPHDHCASPPAPIPDGLEDARHLSIQPTGIDSCIDWWTVDLFVDTEGRVFGITLDLWEP